MFPEAALIGILTGWIRRGRFRHLNKVNLTGFWLAAGALLLQATLWVDFYTLRYLIALTPFLHLFSYLLLLVFIFLNRRHRGMSLFCLGLVMNLAVIGFNGGRMPVDPNRLKSPYREELLSGSASPVHAPLDGETRLVFLADTLRLPYGKHKVISLGDIALAAGLLLFIQEGMQVPARERTKCS